MYTVYIYIICILHMYIYIYVYIYIQRYRIISDDISPCLMPEQPKKTSPSRWRKKLVCRVELPGSSRWRRAPWIPWRSGPWWPWSWGEIMGPIDQWWVFYPWEYGNFHIFQELFQYFRWNHRFISMDWFFREHFNRKAPEWMGKSMVSSGFSLQPIHWI